MNNEPVSRVITYPSTIEKTENHTVTVIDAEDNDLENIGLFLAASDVTFDVYIYPSEVSDLMWLSAISELSDMILIAESSSVTITNFEHQHRIGPNQKLTNFLEYFQNYEKSVDIIVK